MRFSGVCRPHVVLATLLHRPWRLRLIGCVDSIFLSTCVASRLSSTNASETELSHDLLQSEREDIKAPVKMAVTEKSSDVDVVLGTHIENSPSATKFCLRLPTVITGGNVCQLATELKIRIG